MRKVPFMHKFKSLGHLKDNTLRFRLWKRSSDTLAQIAQFEVFHGDVDMSIVLIPSLQFHEIGQVLPAQLDASSRLALCGGWPSYLGSYLGQTGHRSQFPHGVYVILPRGRTKELLDGTEFLRLDLLLQVDDAEPTPSNFAFVFPSLQLCPSSDVASPVREGDMVLYMTCMEGGRKPKHINRLISRPQRQGGVVDIQHVHGITRTRMTCRRSNRKCLQISACFADVYCTEYG